MDNFLAQKLEVKRHKLKNGLTILTHEDKTVPSICYYTFFKVGSRNERPGITGLSHLFEHMMFNGSAKFKPMQFDLIIESGGGYSNGSTTRDYTNYWEEFSSDKLEAIIELEADRMRALRLDDDSLERERSIVKEERRLRYDNDVFGKLYEQLYANAFVAHPYRWPVIGWMADLDNIKLQDAKDYFRTYYAPNNAILVIVGDFKTEEAVKLLERYYADIPAQEPPPSVPNAEEEQLGEKRIKVHKVAQLPAVMIGYHGPNYRSPDTYALDVLQTILAYGQSSRLYQDLIYNKQIASSIMVEFQIGLDPELFWFYAQMQPGKTAEEAEKAIYQILEDIKSNGVNGRELQKAKNIIKASFVRGLKTNQGKAFRLGFYEAIYGDYAELFQALGKYDAVTREDIRRVAARYFTERNRTVLTLVPEAPPGRSS